MSTFSSWSYTATATLWSPSYDEYSQPSGWTRTTFACSYKAGRRQAVSNTGEEFMPRTVVWLEAAAGGEPQTGSKLVIGNVPDAEPPTTAETIRSVRQFDPSTFDEGLPDWEVMTS